MGDSHQNISPGRKKQTAEFQGVQRAIQKPAFWRMGDVATLSVQIENGLPIRPAGWRKIAGINNGWNDETK